MTDPEDQLTLPGMVRAEVRRAPEPAPVQWAAADPVAQVLVDVPHAHLDRPFDYAVPVAMAETAVPGARVKVRFAGQDVDGFVLARVADSEHRTRLRPLRRVVSAEPVLLPEIAALTAAVAGRYAGTRADVLRLAVPPRHGITEKQPSEPAGELPALPARTAWSQYPGGEEFIRGLADGAAPKAVWTAGPGELWPERYAEAAWAAASSGRGVLVCLPDRRDVDRLDAALRARLGEGRHVVLTADSGPAARYRSFLALSRGAVRIAIGTRAAAFAPVRDLGLVAIWDDGDDLYAEPRAPYPHTREVLLLRAQHGAGMLAGAHARSVECQYLVRSGWAGEISLPRTEIRHRVTAAVTGGSDAELARDPGARSSRLPAEVFGLIRSGLTRGPVLVQTPRQGYLTRLACSRCRNGAECPRCHGPLGVSAAEAAPRCLWCGHEEPRWRCPECGAHGLRAPVLGDRRTAEELGRAFPSVPVRTSSGDRVLAEVPGTPALVVATTGAEPVAPQGYAAVLLLDTWLLLARSDLRAEEEALRRWLNAAALVGDSGGCRVVAVGDPAGAALQALVRWDPAGFAERTIEERRSAHLPPASRVATLTAPAAVLAEALADLDLPAGGEVLGPVPVTATGPEAGEDAEDLERCVLRVPRAAGAELSTALSLFASRRSARKLPHVRIEVDPLTLG